MEKKELFIVGFYRKGILWNRFVTTTNELGVIREILSNRMIETMQGIEDVLADIFDAEHEEDAYSGYLDLEDFEEVYTNGDKYDITIGSVDFEDYSPSK